MNKRIEELKSFYTGDNHLEVGKQIRKEKLLDQLKLLTSFLTESVSFSERLYCFLHNLSEYPHCQTCREEITIYIDFKSGYRLFCSKSCANKNTEKKERCKSTCRSTYGGNGVMSSLLVRKKSKETCIKVYGVSNISYLQSIKELKKQTLLQNWGVDSPMKSEELKLRSKETCKNRSEEENKRIQQSRESTMLKKYGYTNPFSDSNWQEKNAKNKKGGGRSKIEQEISTYIQLHFPKLELILNTRQVISPRELDIYIPQVNLAIEFNGLMFHSYGDSKIRQFPGNDQKVKIEKQHFKKFECCFKQNIRLFQIYENEWESDKNKVLEDLKNILLNNEVYSSEKKVTISLDKENIFYYLSNGYILDKIINSSDFYFYKYYTKKIYSTRQELEFERIFRTSGHALLIKDKI